jgi:hypothetical protein
MPEKVEEVVVGRVVGRLSEEALEERLEVEGIRT